MNTVLWDGEVLAAARLHDLYFQSPDQEPRHWLHVAGKDDTWKVCGLPVWAFAFTGSGNLGEYPREIKKILAKGLHPSSVMPASTIYGGRRWEAIIVTETVTYLWTFWEMSDDSKPEEWVNIIRPVDGSIALGEYAQLGNAIMSIGKSALNTLDTLRKHIKGNGTAQVMWSRDDRQAFGTLREDLFELSQLSKVLAEGDFKEPGTDERFGTLSQVVGKALSAWCTSEEGADKLPVVHVPKALVGEFLPATTIETRNVGIITDALGNIEDTLGEYTGAETAAELLELVNDVQFEVDELAIQLLPDNNGRPSPVNAFIMRNLQVPLEHLTPPTVLGGPQETFRNAVMNDRTELFDLVKYWRNCLVERPMVLLDFIDAFDAMHRKYMAYMEKTVGKDFRSCSMLLNHTSTILDVLSQRVENTEDAIESYKSLQCLIMELEDNLARGIYDIKEQA